MKPDQGIGRAVRHPLARALGLAIVLLCAVAPAHAQKSTEQFIPIGMSPGVSHKNTCLGVVDTLSMQERVVTVREPAARRAIRITDKTLIFLDRSKLKLSNLRGRLADIRRGRRVEIKYADPETRLLAEWVKVEMTQP